MPIPHYIAQKIGDKYVLLNADAASTLSKSALLIGGGVTAGLGLSQRGPIRRLLLSAAGTLLIASLIKASRNTAQNRPSKMHFSRGPSSPPAIRPLGIPKLKSEQSSFAKRSSNHEDTKGTKEENGFVFVQLCSMHLRAKCSLPSSFRFRLFFVPSWLRGDHFRSSTRNQISSVPRSTQ